MGEFKLLNYADPKGQPRPGLLVGPNAVIDLPRALKAWEQGAGRKAGFSAVSTLTVLQGWTEALPILHAIADNPGVPTRTLSRSKLMAPIMYPPAIFCAGANYKKHAMEMSPDGKTFPDKTRVQPYFFLKSGPHCIIGPGADIRLPSVSKMIDWEAEFAVVIGRPCRNVSVAQARDYVAGYTIMNDLSARDLGKRDDWPRFASDWLGHKNFDGSAPFGPWIVPADQIPDPYKCRMQLWVNREKMQDELISDLIFNIEEQIEWLSRRLTLQPGDVISTGTPSGVGRPRNLYLKPGDKVKIAIDGIGELVNPVTQGI